MTNNVSQPAGTQSAAYQRDELAERICRAEDALKALRGQFVIVARGQVETMRRLCIGLDPTTDDGAGRLQYIRQISHDLKGQAGSFGLDLVGVLAGQLFDTIRSNTSGCEISVVERFLAEIESILSQ